MTCLSRGFTLLEVMISICLIGLVVTAILEFQAKGMDTARETMELTMAIMLGNEKMVEWERGMIPETGGEGDFELDRPDYKWGMSVIDTERQGLKKVSLLIKWGKEGRTREIGMERLFFKETSR